MTKKELVEALADETGYTRAACLDIIEGLMVVMNNAFARGDSIYLRGLGTFRVRRTKEKIGRDISRRQPVVIPPRLTLKFIPGNELKKRMKEYEG